MKALRSISFGLVLLCTSGLFAQSAVPPPEAPVHIDPQWALAHKNVEIAYGAFVRAAEKDDQTPGVFSDRMNALLSAIDQIHKSQASLASQPGAAYREIFAKTAVMCQRSAILFWQRNHSLDATPGHFYLPPTDEVVTCIKTLAQPDPE